MDRKIFACCSLLAVLLVMIPITVSAEYTGFEGSEIITHDTFGNPNKTYAWMIEPTSINVEMDRKEKTVFLFMTNRGKENLTIFLNFDNVTFVVPQGGTNGSISPGTEVKFPMTFVSDFKGMRTGKIYITSEAGSITIPVKMTVAENGAIWESATTDLILLASEGDVIGVVRQIVMSLFAPIYIIPNVGFIPKIILPLILWIPLLLWNYIGKKKKIGWRWVFFAGFLFFLATAVLLPTNVLLMR